MPTRTKKKGPTEKKLTLDEIKARGWTFSNQGTCNRCGDAIEWWKTAQNNSAPLNPMNRGTDEVVFHTKTCGGNPESD